jgi:hypothetical protein
MITTIKQFNYQSKPMDNIVEIKTTNNSTDPYLEELDLIMYAFRDQARLYRRLRRDVENGVIDHYDVNTCTERMREANANALRYERLLSSETK